MSKEAPRYASRLLTAENIAFHEKLNRMFRYNDLDFGRKNEYCKNVELMSREGLRNLNSDGFLEEYYNRILKSKDQLDELHFILGILQNHRCTHHCNEKRFTKFVSYYFRFLTYEKVRDHKEGSAIVVKLLGVVCKHKDLFYETFADMSSSMLELIIDSCQRERFPLFDTWGPNGLFKGMDVLQDMFFTNLNNFVLLTKAGGCYSFSKKAFRKLCDKFKHKYILERGSEYEYRQNLKVFEHNKICFYSLQVMLLYRHRSPIELNGQKQEPSDTEIHGYQSYAERLIRYFGDYETDVPRGSDSEDKEWIEEKPYSFPDLISLKNTTSLPDNWPISNEDALRYLWISLPEPFLTSEAFEKLLCIGADKTVVREGHDWYVRCLGLPDIVTRTPRSLKHLARCSARQNCLQIPYLEKDPRIPHPIWQYVEFFDLQDNK